MQRVLVHQASRMIAAAAGALPSKSLLLQLPLPPLLELWEIDEDEEGEKEEGVSFAAKTSFEYRSCSGATAAAAAAPPPALESLLLISMASFAIAQRAKWVTDDTTDEEDSEENST